MAFPEWVRGGLIQTIAKRLERRALLKSARAEHRDCQSARLPNIATAKERARQGAREAYRGRPQSADRQFRRSARLARFGNRGLWHPRRLAVAMFGGSRRLIRSNGFPSSRI